MGERDDVGRGGSADGGETVMEFWRGDRDVERSWRARRNAEIEMPEARVGRTVAGEDGGVVVADAYGGGVENDFATGVAELAHRKE